MNIKIIGGQHDKFDIIKVVIDNKEYYIDYHKHFEAFYSNKSNPEIITATLVPYFNSICNFYKQFYNRTLDSPQYHRATVAIHSSNGYGQISNIPAELEKEFLDKVEEFVKGDLRKRQCEIKEAGIVIEYQQLGGQNKLHKLLQFVNLYQNAF